MLEIILLYFLCKSMGNVLRDKGRKPLGFQILLVVMWFGGEFLGGAVAGIVHAVRQGGAPMELDLSIYLFAVVGAGCGAGLCFLIAKLLPAVGAGQPQDAYGSPFVDSGQGSPSLPPAASGAQLQNPYRSPVSDFAQGPPWNGLRRKSSGLGIISFVIAIATGLLELALVVVAGVIEASTPGGMDEQSAQAIMIGLGVLGGLALCLIGMGFAIAGLLQKDRNKLFPVLGLVLNALVILAICGLMMLGINMG